MVVLCRQKWKNTLSFFVTRNFLALLTNKIESCIATKGSIITLSIFGTKLGLDPEKGFLELRELFSLGIPNLENL